MKKTAIILAALLAASAFAGMRAGNSDSKDTFFRKLNTFNSVVRELQTGYVDTIDAEELMDNAIGMMLYQLDPYTEYYPSGNQDEILALSAGSYAGIGSIISKRGDNVIIADPYWNSPARTGGLRRGDVIVAVDGDTVRPTTDIGDVSKRLRGQAGTNVRIDVARPWIGPDSLLTFEITRRAIVTEPVPYYGMLPDSTGYICLTTFSESAARDVKSALTKLLAHPGLKGLIIDMRNNGGGLLEDAVQIASLFVARGTEILRTRGREAEERIYKTTVNPIAPELPLVLLVNGQTASSSEILAGAMQDLDRGVVVGSRTYGKGLVQSTRPLPYGDIMKLTTARYYIPSGRLIQALDYSHRNPDGSPARTPDSLTHEFATRAGRIVRDGGGITPDVHVTTPDGNRLLYNIVADFWAYDCATKYYAEHPDSVSPDSLRVTDEMFEAFKASIDPSRFKYDKQCESGLQYLREAAETEGYMTDSVAAQFDILGKMLHHDLSHDLDLNRKDIIEIIDNELALRYFSDADRVRRTLPSDSTLAAAYEVILAPEHYKAILSKKKE